MKHLSMRKKDGHRVLFLLWMVLIATLVSPSFAGLNGAALFDGQQWDLLRSNSRQKNFMTMMFVPRGQTYENAREFINYSRVQAIQPTTNMVNFFGEKKSYTKQDFSLKETPATTARSMMEKAMSEEMVSCPGSVWEMFQENDSSVIIEAKLKSCSYGAPDRREVIKYFLTDEKLYMVNYTMLESSMRGNDRERIWEDKRNRMLKFLGLISNNTEQASCFLKQELTGDKDCTRTPDLAQFELYERTK